MHMARKVGRAAKQAPPNQTEFSGVATIPVLQLGDSLAISCWNLGMISKFEEKKRKNKISATTRSTYLEILCFLLRVLCLHTRQAVCPAGSCRSSSSECSEDDGFGMTLDGAFLTSSDATSWCFSSLSFRKTLSDTRILTKASAGEGRSFWGFCKLLLLPKRRIEWQALTWSFRSSLLLSSRNWKYKNAPEA